MIHRIDPLPQDHSFLLFGARGTGKTTLLRERFDPKTTHFIDLLDPDEHLAFTRRPAVLGERLAALDANVRWVVIDEVQKVPALLDVVHAQLEAGRFRFGLTGSSARKLKRGASNLLAGRAFVCHLFPLTHCELRDAFDIELAMRWGTLPRVVTYDTDEDRSSYLRAYAHTYLREEVLQEQIVRKFEPFTRFLEVAAQTNGTIVNYSKIADDIGADTKTVQAYFQILEDTLVGFLLPPFHRSVRKRQRANPKFYLFDTGVKRALDRTLTVDLVPGTFAYGRAFEHLVILEMHRLNAYANRDFQLFYLRTKDDAEIDVILERPGRPLALVEIKSSRSIDRRDLAGIERFAGDMLDAEAYCLSLDPTPKQIGAVRVLPWRTGLRELGLEAVPRASGV